MALRDFMTASATTLRATLTSGKKGDPSTNLQNVKIMPPSLPNPQGQHAIRVAIGLEGTAVQVWETYTESHEHTDSSVTVTRVPDIVRGDRLTCNGITYTVKWCEENPATSSFGATLLIYMIEDKRA